MRKRWLIAFFVLFICICAFNNNNISYAQIDQPSSNTGNGISFKNQTPVELLDILQKTSKYSDALQQEVEAICNYYGVDGSTFKDLEAKGYDFMTSARLLT